MKVIERVYAVGDWRTHSAIHFGGENDVFGQGVDRVLLRDSNGRPFLPGASIAGACRHWLSRNLTVPEGCRDSPPEVHILFGDDYQSLLTVEDAFADPVPQSVTRDGVRIMRDSGVAADGAKYNFEVLPANTLFRLAFTLVLYDKPVDFREHRSHGDGGKFRAQGGDPFLVSNQRLKQVFRLMLEGVAGGGIGFGAKTRRGLGHGTVESWKLHHLYMDRIPHAVAWLKQSPESVPSVGLETLAQPPIDAREGRFVIDAVIALSSSLLVRSGLPDGNVQFAQRVESGAAVLPGAGMAGALRSRVEKICKTLSGGVDTPIPENMFGWVKKKSEALDPLKVARASRVQISEISLAGGRNRLMVQGRVSIDRFTGAALETALFNEAAYWPGPEENPVHLRIALEKPEPGECGLLLLAFKDLWLGALSVGGESGVGRGRWRGVSAAIGLSDGSRIALNAAQPNLGCTAEQELILNDLVAAAAQLIRNG